MDVKKKTGVFKTTEDALDWLNNDMANRGYHYEKLVPQQISEGDVALFSFKAKIYGEAEVKRVIREEDKVVDTVMGDFTPYAYPIRISIRGTEGGYRLPTEPGQQYSYYGKDVLDDVRNLGKGGISWKSRTVDAEAAKRIGRQNEECAMKYEREVKKATISDLADEKCGYDFESRRPGEDVRHIEVKTAGGHVELTENELAVAKRLGNSYFLYVVGESAIRIIKNPASRRFTAKVNEYRYEPENWGERGESVRYSCE